MEHHGFTGVQWRTAKKQAREVLMEKAKQRSTIKYWELVKLISSMPFEPHDSELGDLLREISTEEDTAGRGMLTAVVVRKRGGLPARGFFHLAESFGRDVFNKRQFWLEEIGKVYDYWSNQ